VCGNEATSILEILFRKRSGFAVHPNTNASCGLEDGIASVFVDPLALTSFMGMANRIYDHEYSCRVLFVTIEDVNLGCFLSLKLKWGESTYVYQQSGGAPADVSGSR
jgi:hypothetical protein